MVRERGVGTMVLPEAEPKIYVTASPEGRARCRNLELLERRDQASYERILSDLEKRYLLDSESALSPFSQLQMLRSSALMASTWNRC